ncbi:hypothetical protein ACMGDM_05280 [Sphingomonas sp. DT-51]|uniref:hypothetical protein n=1 Tax=Sphingomonas sp. DT-51 TaxID=3396165 RepID=UPI003F1BB615
MHSIAALALLLAAAAPAGQAKTPADAAERAADHGDKMICKRFAKTGTLVGSERVCKTKADWERERDTLRGTTRSTGCQMASLNGC